MEYLINVYHINTGTLALHPLSKVTTVLQCVTVLLWTSKFDRSSFLYLLSFLPFALALQRSNKKFIRWSIKVPRVIKTISRRKILIRKLNHSRKELLSISVLKHLLWSSFSGKEHLGKRYKGTSSLTLLLRYRRINFYFFYFFASNIIKINLNTFFCSFLLTHTS